MMNPPVEGWLIINPLRDRVLSDSNGVCFFKIPEGFPSTGHTNAIQQWIGEVSCGRCGQFADCPS